MLCIFSEYPTIVECEIYVENFDSVNEAAMVCSFNTILNLQIECTYIENQQIIGLSTIYQ